MWKFRKLLWPQSQSVSDVFMYVSLAMNVKAKPTNDVRKRENHNIFPQTEHIGIAHTLQLYYTLLTILCIHTCDTFVDVIATFHMTRCFVIPVRWCCFLACFRQHELRFLIVVVFVPFLSLPCLRLALAAWSSFCMMLEQKPKVSLSFIMRIFLYKSV